jgi:hypothetical protein
VHDAIEPVVLAKQARHRVGIAQVAFNKGCSGRHGCAMTLVEIVEHNDIVTGCKEFCGADASNITGAAGDKDFQGEPPWQDRIGHSIAQAAHNRD